MKPGTLYIVLRGATFPVREEIKKRGGEFDGDRSAWVLLVPKRKRERESLAKWIEGLSRSINVEEI